MKAYCKETEKPLVDNKPDTPTDEQVLGDLFGDCHVSYLFATQTKENSTGVEPRPVSGIKLGRKQPKYYPGHEITADQRSAGNLF